MLHAPVGFVSKYKFFLMDTFVGLLEAVKSVYTIGEPDSGSYHQRPTRLPAEDCGLHSRSFEEAVERRRCLH